MVPPIPKDFQVTWNFIYEVYFYNGLDVFRPWENSKSVIPALLEEWEKTKGQLWEMFQKRENANTFEKMKKGIAIFLQLIFWSNDQPVSLLEPFPWEQLKYKPVNLEERFNFIASRPNLFHSFRQLAEVIGEQEKLFVKKNIMKKDV